MMRGVLVLVVGPSGAGKDTLIDGARAALADDARFVFPRRVITRPADAGGEDHIAATPEAFDRTETAGGFLLSWRAHDLAYGVPASVGVDLAAGRCAVVNVSRTVIEDARARLQPVWILSVTADSETLKARLAARGREAEEGVAGRTARAAAFTVAGPDVVGIANTSSVAEGVQRFVEALRRIAEPATAADQS